MLDDITGGSGNFSNPATEDLNMNNNSISSINDLNALTGVFSSSLQANNFLGTYIRLAVTDTEPASPLEGHIYSDNSENRLKFYNGTEFKALAFQDEVGGAGADFKYSCLRNSRHGEHSRD